MFVRVAPRLVATSVALSLAVAASVGAAASSAAVMAPEAARLSVPAFPSDLVLATSCASIPEPCRTSGAQVSAVQSALVRRGWVIGQYTPGVYGSTTAATVKRYKTAHPGLGPSNMVGPRTYASITRSSAADSGSPTPTTSPRFTRIEQCLSIGGTDPTTTAAARTSESARRGVTLSQFVRSRMGCKVVVRESGGDCSVIDGSGTYFGKWQLDMQEWPYYGGSRYSRYPHQASCAIQDAIAYRNWIDRGWTPWTTAY